MVVCAEMDSPQSGYQSKDRNVANLNVLQLADNDMLVDEYEQYNHDRTDVVVVSRAGSEEEPEAVSVANDCTILLSFTRLL